MRVNGNPVRHTIYKASASARPEAGTSAKAELIKKLQGQSARLKGEVILAKAAMAKFALLRLDKEFSFDRPDSEIQRLLEDALYLHQDIWGHENGLLPTAGSPSYPNSFKPVQWQAFGEKIQRYIVTEAENGVRAIEGDLNGMDERDLAQLSRKVDAWLTVKGLDYVPMEGLKRVIGVGDLIEWFHQESCRRSESAT